MNYRSIALLSTLVLTCASPSIAIASPDEATPPVGDDSLIVKMADGSQVQTVNLICRDGTYRSTQALSNGTTTFSEVPNGFCTLEFKGETPGDYTPVRRGNAYRCSIISKTAVCK